MVRKTARAGAALCAVLAAAVTASGCTASRGTAPAGPAVRVPGAAGPAPVAAAFYVAWASVDTLTDQAGTYLARCAPLVTGALERQLSAGQPATAAWAAMRREHLVSLVTVTAVTAPDGAPAPGPGSADLRVYAVRVTSAAGIRRVSSDGITLALSRSGTRWLVSAVLFW